MSVGSILGALRAKGEGEGVGPVRNGGFIGRLHRDQSGSISIASVFALILLSFLLGLVMNASRQADHRIKLQNAADAAAYSGGIVMARSINTIAFTNHLTADVMALTAFFREARDGHSVPAALEVLDHWRRIAPHLADSEFPKFAQLGSEIPAKVDIETRMVQDWSVWALAMSESMLPVLEAILNDEAIPNFQRDLVVNTPRILQAAVDQVVQRHVRAWPYAARARAVVWRSLGSPIDGPDEAVLRSVPVVDPVLDPTEDPEREWAEARGTRDALARIYLTEWNDESLRAFDRYGRMSRFADLWRSFTCGQLERLIEENRDRNLPLRMRRPGEVLVADLAPEERDFAFVAVVYAAPLTDRVPRIFSNPMVADQIAFAQTHVFVSRARLRSSPILHLFDGSFRLVEDRHLGGMPRDFAFDQPLGAAVRSARADQAIYDQFDRTEGIHEYANWRWGVRREGSHAADAFSQNWRTQLVPATATRLNLILGSVPAIDDRSEVVPPALIEMVPADLHRLTHH